MCYIRSLLVYGVFEAVHLLGLSLEVFFEIKNL